MDVKTACEQIKKILDSYGAIPYRRIVRLKDGLDLYAISDGNIIMRYTVDEKYCQRTYGSQPVASYFNGWTIDVSNVAVFLRLVASL